jgi:hypothetical protein
LGVNSHQHECSLLAEGYIMQPKMQTNRALCSDGGALIAQRAGWRRSQPAASPVTRHPFHQVLYCIYNVMHMERKYIADKSSDWMRFCDTMYMEVGRMIKKWSART